ncbi:hypothetical protein [Actinophytocola algeriensis]|uniref:4-amino-4-deoxy-L-arabinose transferase-like glycosyltransferase n=1 Tax=Actinophytocola algeriensis TaxID=1768010 RepID=A0A7W7VE63_9PSEU|nr:hypothetical protein [Actinophytocola algeriensis]MBB4906794.1 hypothetical protein [Actinophytocola algeriensis]MBE1478275.1 hypothetical protein [Actinophytocola algeriensis]
MTSTVTDKSEPDSAPEERAGEAPATAGTWWQKLERFATTRWLARLIEFLALVPAAAMTIEVARAPELHFVDYWYALVRFVSLDGSLNFGGLWKASNEHLIAVPSMLYYGDATIFGGDQRILGYLDILIALATVVLIRFAIPRSLPVVVRASIVLASSALIFSLHGLHNFTHAMSGAAWLTANLISVGALLFAVKGKWWPAWGMALLGSITYGTAFAVWPSLALVAILRKEPVWRRVLPLALGAVIVVGWMSVNHNAAGSGTESDIGTAIYGLFAVIGKVWTANNTGMAVFAGAVIVAGYATMATVKAAKAPELRFWWGLGCHGFFGSAMIAVSRIDFGLDYSQHSRYTSVSVLVSLPLLVIIGTVVHSFAARHWRKIAVAFAVAGVTGFALGVPTADTVRAENADHEIKSVALRAGYLNAFGWALPPEGHQLVPRLEALGHYPFNDDFTLGCGGPELGDTIDMSGVEEIGFPTGGRTPASPAGVVDLVEEKPGSRLVWGWATGVKDPVRCTVLVDSSDKVVGGGVSDRVRSDIAQQYLGINADTGFGMVGPDEDDLRVVVILESGAKRWMPAEVPDDEDQK